MHYSMIIIITIFIYSLVFWDLIWKDLIWSFFSYFFKVWKTKNRDYKREKRFGFLSAKDQTKVHTTFPNWLL